MAEAEQMPKPRCIHCGSIDVLKDAFARWDENSQQWVLHQTYNFYHCEECCDDARTVDFLI